MANKYVREAASGTGSGDDWTNAYTDLPATLVRGNTYYVADGTYGFQDFNTANSGTTLITIKKATASDHGTETGWNSAYGDGFAEFYAMYFDSDHWLIDGVVGQWADDLPGYVEYGFKVFRNEMTTGQKVIRVGTSGDPRTNVTFRHVEAAWTNTYGTPGTWVKGLDVYQAAGNDHTVSWCWFHDAGRVNAYTLSGGNFLFEYSVFDRNGMAQANEDFASAEHSEIFALSAFTSDAILRYNVIRDWRSTGGVNFHNEVSNLDVEVYGNIFNTTGFWTPAESGDSNGMLNGLSSSLAQNVKVYNNTFVNCDHGSKVCVTGVANPDIKNNIFYNCENFDGPDLELPASGHDYNWFYASGVQSETNIQNGAGNPFVDILNNDFRLASATNAGTTLAAGYDVDADGVTRGGDGTWDRGAFEFESEAGPPPSDYGGHPVFSLGVL